MTCTERKAWLAERQQGIGGTDIASIAGVGFQDAADVYAEKVAAEPIDNLGSPIMRMGLATEALNAELYLERAGNGWMKSPGLVRCNSEPWQFATFDRFWLLKEGPCRSVELKYAGPFFGDRWGADGTDELPEGYIIQATWQTAIAVANGATMAAPHVSVLAGSGEHRVYNVPFSRRLADLLLELGEVFWNRVKNREPVGPDWNHPLREKIAESLIVKPHTWVRLGADAEELVAEWDRLAFVKAQGEDAAEAIKGIKNRLRECLGENQEGQLADGRRVKQNLIAGLTVAPKPYYREPRVDVRILKGAKR